MRPSVQPQNNTGNTKRTDTGASTLPQHSSQEFNSCWLKHLHSRRSKVKKTHQY